MRRSISSPSFSSVFLSVPIMDCRALEKAESRLRIAKQAIADLQASQSYDDFSDRWYVFLTSFKNTYTVLEQGAKQSPQSRQWFGKKKRARKNDQLLQYLFEARNDDEHGLDSPVQLIPEKHEIGIRQPGFSNTVLLNGGPFRNVVVSGFETAVVFEGQKPPPGLQAQSLDGKPVLVKRTPSTTVLADVTARGGRTIHPPTSHLDKAIEDRSPVAVAILAVSYLETLLADASSLA